MHRVCFTFSKKKRKLSEVSPPAEKKQKTKTNSSEELAEEKALRVSLWACCVCSKDLGLGLSSLT